MLKNKRYLKAFLSLFIMLVLWQIYCNKANNDLLQKRIAVSIVFPKNNKIKPDRNLEESLNGKIPKGTMLRFSEKAELSIKPKVKGLRGVFFSFAIKTKNKKKIETEIFLVRNKKFFLIKRYNDTDYYRKFTKEIVFLENDEIIIRTKGNGTILINKPLLYKIIDKEERKYIFAIALDTFRYDSMGKKRNGVKLTESIEALKPDSIVFNNAFAQSNWTLPSFTSFFTGLYEFNHQVTRTTKIGKDKPFLIEEMRKKFLTVNYNSGLWLEGKFGFSRGFDYFDTVSSPTDSYGGKKLFERTIGFLKKSRMPSVFMFLHTYQIHSPYSPPDKYIKSLNLNVKNKTLDTFFYKKQYLSKFDKDLPEEMRKLYEAEILAFDEFFKSFIDSLKKMGIYKQSLIVFFSDHGEEFYEHKAWAHAHSMYNEVIKVPLFIKLPHNDKAGKTIDENVGLIDILPTIMDYNGIKGKRKTDGLSLMPLIHESKWNRKELFSSTSVTWLVKQIQPKFAIIGKEYKIIYNFPFSKKNELFFKEYGLPQKVENIQIFNLKTDLNENRELMGKEKAKIKKRYMSIILSIRNKIEKAVKKKRNATIRFNDIERKKLKSLGYL